MTQEELNQLQLLRQTAAVSTKALQSLEGCLEQIRANGVQLSELSRTVENLRIESGRGEAEIRHATERAEEAVQWAEYATKTANTVANSVTQMLATLNSLERSIEGVREGLESRLSRNEARIFEQIRELKTDLNSEKNELCQTFLTIADYRADQQRGAIAGLETTLQKTLSKRDATFTKIKQVFASIPVPVYFAAALVGSLFLGVVSVDQVQNLLDTIRDIWAG